MVYAKKFLQSRNLICLLSVVILFDISGSILKNELSVHSDSARKFIKEANPANEYSIFSFNAKTLESQNWTQSSESIDASIDSILAENRNPYGQTSLDDAILKGIERFENAKYESKLLLIFSDGRENSSSRNSKKLAEQIIKTNDIVIQSMYCSRCGKNSDNPNNEYALSEIPTDLERYCETTGGKFYFPKSEKEATESLHQIVNYFRSRYKITYKSTNQKRSKNGWQKIAVKAFSAKIKSLTAYSRKGYFTN
jgi:VWFA-related protein